ncbi:hypothetical protein GQ457_02G034450 [Hibiscus cannabinus]
MRKHHVTFAIESLALPQYLLGDGNTRVVNHGFVSYKQQDSALCYWLLASIGSSIFPSLISCRTALDIWEKIQSLFSVSSTT